MNLTRIEKIRFVREIDTNPDLDWIGTFSNEPEEGAIDRSKIESLDRNQYRYFNPANPEYAKQEYEHMMNLEKGNSSMYGVRAEAIVYLSGVRQTIRSGGLWGLEHNGSKETEADFVDEEGNQLEELIAILKDNLRFSAEEIETACKNVEKAK